MFFKKGFLRNFTKLAVSVKASVSESFFNKEKRDFFFNKKRDSGTGVFCEFFEISKNTFLHRTHLEVASMFLNKNVANFTGI